MGGGGHFLLPYMVCDIRCTGAGEVTVRKVVY